MISDDSYPEETMATPAKVGHREQSASSPRVLHAALLISVLSVFSKLSGFVREQVIATQFGASSVVDAFVVASLLPQVFAASLGGAMSSAFMPVFIRAAKTGDERGAWSLAYSVMRMLLFSLLVLCTVSWVFAPVIVRLIAPGFADATVRQAVSMLRVMVPGMALIITVRMLMSTLHAHKRFAWAAIAPVVTNIATIIATIVLVRKLGVVGLAWATVAGLTVDALILCWPARHYGKAALQARGPASKYLKEVMLLVWPILAGTLFGEAYTLIDKAFAAGLDAGSIAALSYARKLVHLPTGIVVMAFSTALYPTLAEYAGIKNITALHRTVVSGMKLLSLLMFPAAIGMIVLRVPICALAFQRGTFDSEATSRTAIALGFYAIGLGWSAGTTILTRGFYSLKDSITPVITSAATAIINVLLAMLLVTPLGHGGLALANSLGGLLHFLANAILFERKTGERLALVRSYTKYLLASALMGVAVWVLSIVMKHCTDALVIGTLVPLAMLSYLILLLVLKVPEAKTLLTQSSAFLKRMMHR